MLEIDSKIKPGHDLRDQVLVECLRIFARRGRYIRMKNQNASPDYFGERAGKAKGQATTQAEACSE